MTLRDDASSIYKSCIKNLNPSSRVYDYLKHNNFIEKDFESLFVVSFGKASIGMMDGALKYIIDSNLQSKILGDPIVVTNQNCPELIHNVNINAHTSSHPTPSELSVSAAKDVYAYVADAQANDIVLVLISGGGSSLLSMPIEEITLEDKINTTNVLLKCGANINEINSIRKHISNIKGGKLAMICNPANCFSLIISDVINDDLSTIASGPTSPDLTTYNDCLEIIKKYNIEDEIPENVFNILISGKDNKKPETPKVLKNITNNIICSNRIFRKELSAVAHKYGYKPILPDIDLNSEAVTEGKNLYDLVESVLKDESSNKFAIITGGETVVNLTGDGVGGRNQELSVAFLDNVNENLASLEWSLLSVGTDGIDGPTNAAGALLDNTSLELLRQKDLNIKDFLINNDSNTFLKKIDSLFITGPSGNNVADIQIVLVDRNI